MVFFDLSVPYHERDVASTQDNSTTKASRLKVVVKSMELGYTGVAYDRLIKGVMSDKDRCTIAPFPLSSLLKAAPALAESVKFHRELLGVPVSTPFRQYRRLTVVVDSAVQVAVLNSGNPVIKTYDLVAVRPMNQVAFEQSCKLAEVDLIAIDFSQKLPFRLKLPMVKAAIERGIYFEITYSHLITNAHSRRETLQNAKMLVNWTRGRNIILSSAASSVNEIRGPYDVANLSSLFGLSTEHAKAAVSKNCRFMLASALRKKQYHKDAIRVESISPNELNSDKNLLSEWSNWDPISSGEGDLPPLNDLVKSFIDAADTPKKVPKDCFTIKCVTIPENGEHESKIFNKKTLSSENDTTSISLDTEDLKPYCATTESPNLDRLHCCLSAKLVPSPATPSTHREGSLFSHSKFNASLFSIMESVSVISDQDHMNILERDDEICDITMQQSHDMPLEDSISKNALNLGFPDDKKGVPSFLYPKVPKNSDDDNIVSDTMDASNDVGPMNHTFCDEGQFVPSSGTEMCNSASMEFSSNLAGPEELNTSNEHDVDCRTEHYVYCKSKDLAVKQVLTVPEYLVKEDFALNACITSVQECFAEFPPSDQGNDVVLVTDSMPVKSISEETKIEEKGNFLEVASDMPIEGLVKIEECEEKSSASANLRAKKHKSGKGRFMENLRHHSFQFPSKGFLKPLLFKRKVQRLKGSKKHHVKRNV